MTVQDSAEKCRIVQENVGQCRSTQNKGIMPSKCTKELIQKPLFDKITNSQTSSRRH
jgi:hypothetical protein